MKPFLAALSMLTICPLGSFCPTEDQLKKSLNYFPWVGLLMGIVSFLILKGCVWAFPHIVAALCATLLPEILTKCFHLDGVADTADAFLSGRDQTRKLEIMRDSHIGTMGVFAIVAVLGAKFAFYASISSLYLPLIAGCAALVGRCGMLLYISMSQYARKTGLGALWFGFNPWVGLIVLKVLICVVAYFLYDVHGIAFMLAVLLFAWIWKWITKSVIGGATGDTIGCFEELSELFTIATLTLVIYHGYIPNYF